MIRLLGRFSSSTATTLARLSTIGMLLGVMALGARRLSPEAFGIWAILYTLMNFAPALDFGFRYALGNRMAALKAEPDASAAQRDCFITVFHLQCVIALVGAAACYFGLGLFNWAKVFKLQDPTLSKQVQMVFPLVCSVLMLNQPLSLAGSALFADQRIELASMAGVAQAIVLLGAFALGSAGGSLRQTAFWFFGAYLACGLAITLLLFQQMSWRWKLPAWASQAALLQSLSRPSFDFFVLSAIGMTASAVGPLVAGTMGSAKVAGDFTLIQRFFSLLVTIHLAALAPLAPAYTLHARHGDWTWVRAKLHSCLWIIWPLLFIGGSAVLFLAHPLLLRIWSGHWLANYPLAGALAVGAVLMGFGNSYSILLNSLGLIRPQAVLSVIMLLPVIVLPAFLSHYYGVVGVAIAACICTIPSCFLTWHYASQALRDRYLRV